MTVETVTHAYTIGLGFYFIGIREQHKRHIFPDTTGVNQGRPGRRIPGRDRIGSEAGDGGVVVDVLVIGPTPTIRDRTEIGIHGDHTEPIDLLLAGLIEPILFGNAHGVAVDGFVQGGVRY